MTKPARKENHFILILKRNLLFLPEIFFWKEVIVVKVLAGIALMDLNIFAKKSPSFRAMSLS